MKLSTAIGLLGVLGLFGCQGKRSGVGLKLPTGDPVQGKAKFIELGCASCHTISGVVGLPKPVATPPVRIELGGEVYRAKNDGQMLTAIINPSHRVKFKTFNATAQPGGLSRMGDYTEAMTVRELLDIVSFLHTTYRTVPTPTP